MASGRLAYRAVSAFKDEIYQFHGQGLSGETFDSLGKAVPEKTLAFKYGLVGASYFMEVCPGETSPLQPDGIEARKPGVVSDNGAERYHIFNNDGAAANERIPADPAELMNGCETTEPYIVANFDMPGEGNIIGHHDIVADRAIMSNVGPDHDVAIFSNARQATMFRHSRMGCRVLAEDRPCPNLQTGVWCFAHANDLRATPQNRVRIQKAVFADLRVANNAGVRNKFCTRSKLCGG